MAVYIDRHLTNRIKMTGETGLVEAVIVVRELEGDCLPMDDGGLSRQVIERAAERAGDLPRAVRYFPRANAAVISASARLIQEILLDENLAVASTPDMDALWFFHTGS